MEQPNPVPAPNQDAAAEVLPMEVGDQPNETNNETMADRLLKMSKKAAVALTKAEAHKAFIASCQEQDKTPKGLRVKVRC